jgi:uncharacterized protein DUF4326
MYEGRPAADGTAHPQDTTKEKTVTTTVISLKGRIHDYGPRLEHAPKNFVYVGRPQTQGGWRLQRHPLANPHRVRTPCDAKRWCKDPECAPCRACDSGAVIHTLEEAVSLYCQHLLDRSALLALVPPSGSVLGCWCARKRLCHGHVLAVLADVPDGRMEPHLRGMADYPVLALEEYAAS